ncbi:MAG TPA: apolipoprotein N-acyltransferase [Gammaproteobacteria bacterium]|nr:apolipoprotein N-acyltransferase [Gammaproteobacteria bacterium]
MKFNNFFAAGIKGDFLAIAAGILLTFAFAPLRLYPLAVILPAILYALWQNVTPARAFLRGWLFGLGFFGAGIYWVFISIHTFGNASCFLAGFFTVGLIAILSLFPGLTGFLLNRYFPYPDYSRIFYAFPTIWVFLEWVRSWIFTGFPWLLLGYSQITSPLKGFAPIIGVYGLSLLVLFSSCLLIQIYIFITQKNYRNSILYLLILILLWGAGAYLNTISWTQALGKPVTVSLVQGNIAQEMKWSPDHLQSTLDTYQKLTGPHWNSKIIIWPESAIPIPMQNAVDFLASMDNIAKKNHAAFITGIPVHLADGKGYYNAVITLGNGKGYYLKHRLVPFGEYTPFHPWLDKFLDVLNIPMSDFVAATDPPLPLIANGVKIGTFICYEIAFPEMVAASDSNIFLTVSNDAWFGHSIAQAQHLEMAQMRAAENGRPVLFVSNNGTTAVINPDGKIKSEAPPYVPYVLTDTVQPMQGQTHWQKQRMDPVLFTIILFILFAIRDQRSKLKIKGKKNKVS